MIGGIAAQLLAQLLLTYAPFMQALFDTAPLDAWSWVLVALVALAGWAVISLEKTLAARSARSSAQSLW